MENNDTQSAVKEVFTYVKTFVIAGAITSDFWSKKLNNRSCGLQYRFWRKL